jgi:hypothetical protein
VEINFLNPSETSSNELSAKSDGVDTTYHLVAAVRDPNLPQPSVIFQFENERSNIETTIGAGTRVGTTDTYEFDWNLSGVGDGTYLLKAVYFSGSTEVGRDEDEVVVNNAGEEDPILPTDDEQAETAEFVYPENGGMLGFFTTGSGASIATTAVLEVSLSEAASSVIAYYSITEPGQEPVYIECGDADPTPPEENSATQVQCTLEEPTSPSAVTAVAAVAIDAADDPLLMTITESGDGHRVTGYTQVPTDVTLDPATQTQAVNVCAQVITATVVDQEDRSVSGVNVDAHAQGPTDNLFFDDNDTSGNNSSSSKPPDMNHATDEAAANCESAESPPPRGGTQGQHENPDPSVPGGSPDVKHIESRVGTNLDGEFKFQLTSGDSGGTQITAWADTDGNDQRCSEEASGNASIGWAVFAPTPATVTADGDGDPCPTPTPSASPSTSTSPSASPSTSPSPTTSPTPDPSGDRRIGKFSGNKTRVHRGRFVRFTGRVFADEEACSNRVKVKFKKKVRGKPGWRLVSTKDTDTNGDFAFKSKVFKRTKFRVDAPPESFCDRAKSRRRTVRIRN